MIKHALPLVDLTRTEFGFARSLCACPECTRNCRYIPGYLIPADLTRIHQHLAPGEDLFSWARRHLLASPGAKVAQRGKVFRIRTLVPARQSNRVCTFLTTEDCCAIHAVAPFACAFFDSHMPTSVADRRSIRGLEAIQEAWANGDAYAQVWAVLNHAGLRAPAPEICRQHLDQTRNRNQAP